MKATLRHLAGLALLVSGCATHQPTISSRPSALERTNGLHIRFGVAALARDSRPATYSFQKASGKLGSAREGFAEAAELAVGGPAFSVIIPGIIMGEVIQSADNEGQVMLGAAGAGIAGGATVVGIAFASPPSNCHPRVNPVVEKNQPGRTRRTGKGAVEGYERNSRSGAVPEIFVESRGGQVSRAVVAIPADDQSEKLPDAVDAVLEARVEELRLERSRSDEGSYFLRIKVRARLVRVADRTLLYEQPVEYRSSHSLFLDWTLHSAVEGVAESGYRALAQYIVDRIL